MYEVVSGRVKQAQGLPANPAGALVGGYGPPSYVAGGLKRPGPAAMPGGPRGMPKQPRSVSVLLCWGEAGVGLGADKIVVFSPGNVFLGFILASTHTARGVWALWAALCFSL